MFPKYFSHGGVSQQQAKNISGSALVVALFVIIVMSILGAGLVKILDSSSETVAYEVIGTRAFQTAQIGLQWGVQQRFPLLPATPTHCDGTVVTAVSSDSSSDLVGLVPDFSDVEGLKGCHVTKLLCTDFRVDGETYFTIESTGQCDSGDVITVRKLEVTARTL